MVSYSDALARLFEAPSLPVADGSDSPDRALAKKLIETVRGSGRSLLTESESKQLLAAYGIPIVETRIAETAADAGTWAKKIGFPVVLKLHSEAITHKTDVGGVQLNLQNAEDVASAFEKIRKSVHAKAGELSPSGQRNFLGVTVQPMIKLDGYELILGSSIDPQFGPVLLFGTGGQLVEVYKDRALGLPPLNTTLARRMMEETKIYGALKGVRGRAPVNLQALERLLVAFSTLVVEQTWIKELDINPLLASSERLVALDARVVLHGAETKPEELPRSAIRPYPIQYVRAWKAKDGADYMIRPIRPEDEPLLVKFHQMLSDRTVLMRYTTKFEYQARTAHERLSRICFSDYDRELALVAETKVRDEMGITGVARLIRIGGSRTAELNVIIADEFQAKGLGTELVRRLLQVARDEKLTHIVSSEVLPENQAFQRLSQRLGLASTRLADGRSKIELDI
jgi:acetyltransferase